MLHTDRILVLAPHTDDGELGCGASMAKYIGSGKSITYVAFSTCNQSLPTGFPPGTLATECKRATQILGITDVIFFDFEVRQMSFHRQQILEELVRLNRTVSPQTVFIPAEHDVHQDHHVVYAEALRAFKNCNLLGYELPWNNIRFAPAYFETISQQHLDMKTEALKAYESQAHRRYMKPGFISALATVRGAQCDAEFAEAFEVYRLKSPGM